jgi:nickel-dependent lactate racemase
MLLQLLKEEMVQIRSLVLLFPLEAVEAALMPTPLVLKQKVVVLAVEQGIMVLEQEPQVLETLLLEAHRKETMAAQRLLELVGKDQQVAVVVQER